MILSPWAMPMISLEITYVQAPLEPMTFSVRMMMGTPSFLILIKALTLVAQYVL